MRKIRIVLVLAAIFSVQAGFAQDPAMSSHSKACGAIAKACSNAGYNRTANPGKMFWQDCMKPILLGKTVQGVSLDAATVKTCRMNKIEELKKELREFQKVS